MDRFESVENRYDWSEKEPIVAIVETIAAAEGVDPGALDITLYDYVDTDALDTLIGGDESVVVSFAVGEYTVRIDEDSVRVSRD